MAQPDERTRAALAYVRHQATKSLADLRVLVERTAADCRRCLEGITEEQARFKPGNEWSVKEVLGHLIEATALQATQGIRDLAAGMGLLGLSRRTTAAAGRRGQSTSYGRRWRGSWMRPFFWSALCPKESCPRGPTT